MLVENLSDEALIQKSIENIDYFAELVQRYEVKLLSYIMRISAFGRVESEEILQEVFIKCWRNLYDFDPKLKFSSWIYRITHNETISAFRKAQSRGDDKHISIESNQIDVFDNIDLSDEFDTNISGDQIQHILEDLSAKYRDILVLKFLEEKSYEEISDILQMPMGTVATNINRAKKKFQAAAETAGIKFKNFS